MGIRIGWGCVDEGGGGVPVTSSGLAKVESFSGRQRHFRALIF